MTQQLLATLRPTTLAAMAADLSQYLAGEYDGTQTSAQEWDKLAEDLAAIVAQLSALDDDWMSLLIEAGADPEIILEGKPA